MKKILGLVCIAATFAPLVPPSHAQVDGDYARFAREWRDLSISVRHTVGAITYASDDGARDAAVQELEAMALRGSVHAALQLAIGHLSGAHGVSVHPARSQRYFEFSIRQESMDALFDYGLLLLTGHRFEADAERGQSLIVRAAELGHPAARVFLIEQLQAAGDDLSQAKAEAWRRRMGIMLNRDGQYTEDPGLRAAELGYGYVLLAEYFTNNVWVPADTDRARLYWSKVPADERGYAAADVATKYMDLNYIQADHARAKELFESQLESLSGWRMNNFAWLLSTSPDSRVRDGELAVSLMEDLLASETRKHSWVDTLAAAYAEAGDFGKAIELQDEALAGFTEDTDNYESAMQRRNSYEKRRAWRE